MTRTIVIVGAGLAGAKAAESLREEDFDGRVVLLGAEAQAPYELPPLSKGHLRGDSDGERATPVAYDRLPYFFSDQYDVRMEYWGLAEPSDEVVVRGDLAAREFIAFWLHDGAVVAGMSVDVDDVCDQIQALIRFGDVDRARLADPDVALEELLGQVAAAG